MNNDIEKFRNAFYEIDAALEDLPIISRLEIAKSLICSKAGQEKDNTFDPAMALAENLLAGVIEVIRTLPNFSYIRIPQL